MKTLLAMFVAFVTLFASVSAEAQSLRFNKHFNFGTRPGLNSQDNWFYNQTSRRFNHPDVQNHMAERINHRPNEFIQENGLTGDGSLRWELQMRRQQRETSWTSQGEVTRVCREFSVYFMIRYMDHDSRNRQYRERRTAVHGTLCSPNNGYTWYQERDFQVSP